MTCICLVPRLLPQSICAPGTVCSVQSLLMHRAPSPAVHMPACLLTSCAWPRQSISGVSSCGIHAPSLGPRCLWAVWQWMLCSYRGRPKPCPSCPQDKQVKPWSKDTSPCCKEQHSGGHWSSENSLLLLDPLKHGLWMCSGDRTDSSLPPFTPHIFSLPLLVVTFITITKYCAILQGCIFTEIHSFWWHNVL